MVSLFLHGGECYHSPGGRSRSYPSQTFCLTAFRQNITVLVSQMEKKTFGQAALFYVRFILHRPTVHLSVFNLLLAVVPLWPQPPFDVLRSHSKKVMLKMPPAVMPNVSRPFTRFSLEVQLFYQYNNQWSIWIPWPMPGSPSGNFPFETGEGLLFRFRLRGEFNNGVLSNYSDAFTYRSPPAGRSSVWPSGEVSRASCHCQVLSGCCHSSQVCRKRIKFTPHVRKQDTASTLPGITDTSCRAMHAATYVKAVVI